MLLYFFFFAVFVYNAVTDIFQPLLGHYQGNHLYAVLAITAGCTFFHFSIY